MLVSIILIIIPGTPKTYAAGTNVTVFGCDFHKFRYFYLRFTNNPSNYKQL